MSKKLKTECVKKKEKWKLVDLSDQIPEGEITGTHTEIFGNGRVTVEGCLGVAEYRDSYLKLRLSKGSITLCGSGFDIVSFENKTISVKGSVSSVEFCI